MLNIVTFPLSKAYMFNFPHCKLFKVKAVKVFIITLVFLFTANIYAQEEYSVLAQHELAQQAYDNDESETAYIHLKNVFRQDGNYIPSKVLMGKLLLNYGYFNDAVLEFEEVVNLGADYNLFIQPYSEALLLHNKADVVLTLAKGVRLTTQNATQLHILRGKAQAKLKNLPQELSEYKKALRLSPNHIDVLNSFAGFYIKSEDLLLAQQYIEQSFQLKDEEYLTWHLQAQIYKQQGLNQQAIDAYLKALVLAPEFLDAKRGIASVYISKNEDKKALELIEQVLEESPNDPRAQLLKANLLFQQNENKDAKAILISLNQKISLIPEDIQVKNSWLFFINGVSQYLLENYQAALRNLNRFLQEEKGNFQAISLAVNINLKLENNNRARDLLEQHLDKILPYIEMATTLCRLYIDSNHTFKCEELLPKLKNQHPGEVRLVVLEALILVKRNQATQAIKLLEVANQTQRHALLEKTLVRLYIQTEQTLKAGRLIEQLLKEYPHNTELMNALAGSLIKLKKYPQALGVLEHILAKQPNNYMARYNTASALLEAGAAQQAKVILLNMLDQRSSQANARLLLARTELILGDVNQAILELQTLAKTHPEHVNGNEMLMLLLKRTGKFEQALLVVKKLSKQNTLDENLIKEKTELYLLLGDKDQYQAQVNILHNLWWKDVEKLVLLATMQRNYGDYSGAKITINQAKELAPQNALVNYEDVKISLFEKDMNTAKASLNRLKKSTMEKSKIIVLEGDYFLANKQAKTAQQKYLAAFQLNNANNMALAKAYNLAKLGLAAVEFEKHLLASVKQKNSNIYHRNILADFYLENQRLTEAVEHYILLEQAESLPNRASILNNLAFALLPSDSVKAQFYAEQAVELKPHSAAIVDTYGWTLFKNSKFEVALKTLNQAKSIDSTNTEIRYHLAVTLAELSRNTEAKKELAYVIKNSRSTTEQKVAQALMSKLSKI